VVNFGLYFVYRVGQFSVVKGGHFSVVENNNYHYTPNHGKTIFQILRIVLGVGILIMVISGATFYLLTQKRRM